MDSVAANGPVNRLLVGTTRPSTIRFTHPNSSEENTHDTGSPLPDPGPPASAAADRVLSIKRRADRHFGSERV
jgi:hypothetical protein